MQTVKEDPKAFETPYSCDAACDSCFRGHSPLEMEVLPQHHSIL